MLTSLPRALCKKVNGYSTFSNVTLKNKELQMVWIGICVSSFYVTLCKNTDVECHNKAFNSPKIISDHVVGVCLTPCGEMIIWAVLKRLKMNYRLLQCNIRVENIYSGARSLTLRLCGRMLSIYLLSSFFWNTPQAFLLKYVIHDKNIANILNHWKYLIEITSRWTTSSLS